MPHQCCLWHYWYCATRAPWHVRLLDKQGLPETHVGLCNPRPAERYGSQGEQSHNNQYNGNLREGHPAFVSGSHGATTKK